MNRRTVVSWVLIFVGEAPILGSAHGWQQGLFFFACLLVLGFGVQVSCGGNKP